MRRKRGLLLILTCTCHVSGKIPPHFECQARFVRQRSRMDEVEEDEEEE